MNTEQKAKSVVLDAAQEMQHNETWWREFEGKWHGIWTECMITMNPLSWSHVPVEFRRKTKTIKPEMPVPKDVTMSGVAPVLYIEYETYLGRDTALAAIRAEMEKGK
jgi:hypothetical protein